MSQLEWEYEDPGDWVAASNVVSIDGDLAYWRVRITESGEFSVMASDRELLDEAPPHFATLSLAKQYCEVAEAATETAIRNESKTSPGISGTARLYRSTFRRCLSATGSPGRRCLEYLQTSTS